MSIFVNYSILVANVIILMVSNRYLLDIGYYHSEVVGWTEIDEREKTNEEYRARWISD